MAGCLSLATRFKMAAVRRVCRQSLRRAQSSIRRALQFPAKQYRRQHWWHWFFDCFFFSVQTLATVGYGHMYPQTLYAHVVSTIEIMTGIFLLATMTGLIFVRFSRPTARVVFSKSLVIAALNGKPTLMVRIGNENQHSMVEAEFRIMFSRDE